MCSKIQLCRYSVILCATLLNEKYTTSAYIFIKLIPILLHMLLRYLNPRMEPQGLSQNDSHAVFVDVSKMVKSIIKCIHTFLEQLNG